MTRRKFNADVDSAQQASIPGVSGIDRGESEGEAVFIFTHAQLPVGNIIIRILTSQLDEYPQGSSFFVFTDCDITPKISAAFLGLQDSTAGKNVATAVQAISGRLASLLEVGRDADADDAVRPGMNDTDTEDGEYDEDDELDYEINYDDDDDLDADDDFESIRSNYARSHSPSADMRSSGHEHASYQRLRKDLCTAHEAGFHIGVLDSYTDCLGRLFSISLRAGKLGIPEETLEAWEIHPREFVVLLITFQMNRYMSIEDISVSKDGLRYRFGRCSRPKPSSTSALAAFSTSGLGRDDDHGKDAFRPLYMSQPINRILNEDLVQLIKARLAGQPSWDSARASMLGTVGAASSSTIVPKSSVSQKPSGSRERSRDYLISPSAPASINRDHMHDAAGLENTSILLLAMQLGLRHFVQCTKYCMICSNLVQGSVEAVKPFVCDNPLCLHQYMDLGLGPAAEHEIVSQPSVVDLLISFFYAAANAGQTRAWPTGLSLMVPAVGPSSAKCSKKNVEVEVDLAQKVFQPLSAEIKTPLRERDWILLRRELDHVRKAEYLCRIMHVLPNLVEFELVSVQGTQTAEPLTTSVLRAKTAPSIPAPPTLYDPQEMMTRHDVTLTQDGQNSDIMGSTVSFKATLHPFDTDIQEDQRSAKASLCQLLSFVPPITQMREYLMANPGKDLKAWGRMPPASVTLLRWIIKSNRSAIFQLDPPVAKGGACGGEPAPISSSPKIQHKVLGIGPEYLQFRFAQGTLEKEIRFTEELASHNLVPKPPAGSAPAAPGRVPQSRVPTLFSWHGSPLQNWHSIIRTGLDFNQVAHGRAYGNGVYMSTDFETSVGYTHGWRMDLGWGNSGLPILSAMAICEVVNAPDKFQGTYPHIVVEQTDWIQVRYLLVKVLKSDITSKTLAAAGPPQDGAADAGQDQQGLPHPGVQYLEQDPRFSLGGPLTNVGGVARKRVLIPMAVIPAWRRPYYRALPNSAVGIPAQTEASGAWKLLKRATKGLSAAVAAAATRTEAEAAIEVEYPDSDKDDYDMVLLPRQTAPGKRPRSPNTYLSPQSPAKRISPSGTMAAKDGPQKPEGPNLLDSKNTTFLPGKLDYSTLPVMPNPTWAQPSASKHMSGEIKRLQKAQSTTPLHELGWFIDFDRLSNLFQWIVELHSFGESLPLAKDLKALGCPSIVTEIRFPPSFPMSPPFVRVVRPRFLRFIDGGGGHVTAGGSMCMELLTASGWSPAFSLESVLMQVRLALSNLEPKPARVMARGRAIPGGDYGISEAVSAYVRVAQDHGWRVPADLTQTGGAWV